ncbi:hypothetical protein [Ideonella sp. A 288]|uniref:hypothetical protein n=1 Tax=Ideonella sp. A 288 TaxID=1962181 RepID=UPI001302EB7A|nr:hypothetical protein [Ideonella sp. A 288]
MSAYRRTGPSADIDPIDDEIDEPLGDWSLDEPDDDADVASLRSTWAAADGFDE